MVFATIVGLGFASAKASAGVVARTHANYKIAMRGHFLAVIGLHFAGKCSRAFSSEVDTGSLQENASEQKARASVPIQSERRL
jgi:hypothetical protein